MTHRISPNRPDMTTTMTVARPTPPPVRIRFSEVLARGGQTFLQGAESALRILPGAPLLAVAVRGGTSSGPTSRIAGMLGTTPGTMAGMGSPTTRGVGGAEGPGPTVGGGSGGLPGSGGDGGVESSLAQSQEMNIYYLQIQEAVNAQNRTFSTLSNVLKAEHDTVKTAIGNIR